MGIRARNLRLSVATLVSVCMALTAFSPSVHAGTRNDVARAADEDFDLAMEQAERERSVGLHREAGKAYIRAYHLLPSEEQTAGTGEFVVQLALEEYDVALDQGPSLLLYDEPISLLESYIEARVAAHAAGAAAPVPPRFAKDLEVLKVLRETHTASAVTPVADGGPPVSFASEDGLSERVEDRPAKRGGRVILGAGAVVAAAGASLMGLGLWNTASIDRQYRDALAGHSAEQHTIEDDNDFRRSLLAWRSDSRNDAMGLIVGGAAASAVGLGLMTWGIVRHRRMRDRGRLLARTAMIAPTRRGMMFAVEF